MSPMVRLRPTAHPVRRAPDQVQFGLSPSTGIVLAGLTEAESELLLSLAQSAGTARDVSLAERFAVPLARVREFIGVLRSTISWYRTPFRQRVIGSASRAAAPSSTWSGSTSRLRTSASSSPTSRECPPRSIWRWSAR